MGSSRKNLRNCSARDPIMIWCGVGSNIVWADIAGLEGLGRAWKAGGLTCGLVNQSFYHALFLAAAAFQFFSEFDDFSGAGGGGGGRRARALIRVHQIFFKIDIF
jgi:hypothetical protein